MKYEIEKFYDDSQWVVGRGSVPAHKRAEAYINERQEEGWHVFQLTTTPRPNGDVTITVIMVQPGRHDTLQLSPEPSSDT